MTFTKLFEIGTEAIPGCVLQSYVLVKAWSKGSVSKRAIFSICCSALSTGFSCATISYDYGALSPHIQI
jgi:hypothetical protein